MVIFRQTEPLIGLIFLASLTIILIALISQHVGGLQPCDLCYKQRWVYYAAIAFVPLALLLYARGQVQATQILLFIFAAAFFANMILGVYHAGVEWKWWAGPSGCTGGGQLDASIDLLKALEKIKIVPCDEVQWSFLGLSMAGYSALASLALGLLSLLTIKVAQNKS